MSNRPCLKSRNVAERLEFHVLSKKSESGAIKELGNWKILQLMNFMNYFALRNTNLWQNLMQYLCSAPSFMYGRTSFGSNRQRLGYWNSVGKTKHAYCRYAKAYAKWRCLRITVARGKKFRQTSQTIMCINHEKNNIGIVQEKKVMRLNILGFCSDYHKYIICKSCSSLVVTTRNTMSHSNPLISWKFSDYVNHAQKQTYVATGIMLAKSVWLYKIQLMKIRNKSMLIRLNSLLHMLTNILCVWIRNSLHSVRGFS